MEKKESKVLPLLSLIFGIASLLTMCIIVISCLCAVVSIILAIISFVKKKPVPMPIIGLICSFFGIIATIVITIVGTTIGVAVGENSMLDSARKAAQSLEEIEEQEELESILSNLENNNVILNEEENIIEENTIIENTMINNVVSSTDQEISEDWKAGEFIFDGKKYKLFDKYSNLELAGWTFDMGDYGYDDNYVLNSKEKTFGTIYLENIDSDARVSIGLQNNNSAIATIKECEVWSFEVANSFAKNPVDFTLAKGIKNGSTLAEVKAAYGEPDDTYYAESLEYWVYTYDNELEPKLRLTIYEDITKGLSEFEYSYY